MKNTNFIAQKLANYRRKKLRNAEKVARDLGLYAVYNLWNGEYYFIMRVDNYTEYTQQWLKIHVKWIIKGSLIFIM